ncbi:MAG: squalene/phytoene synthase family protein [Pseudomonadota bacterium]
MSEPQSERVGDTSAPDSDDVIATAARAYEIDRYLSALLAPRHIRDDLIALAAFAGDVARIPVMVSEPMIGEIRLQWWRDAITTGRAGIESGNPIADRFSAAVRRHDLPPQLVERVIDLQSVALHGDPIADDMALKSHVAGIDGTLFQLAARMVDGEAGALAQDWIDRAGVAYGLARTAVEFSAVLAQGRTFAPVALLESCGTSLARLLDGDEVGAQRVLGGLCNLAEVAHESAGQQLRQQARSVRIACLPIAMVVSYCARARQVGGDVLRRPIEVAPLVRVWRLWRYRYGMI